MATSFDFVQRQIEMYTNQSEQSEHWKPDHHEAMACRNLEDAIALGNTIFESIGRQKVRVTVADASKMAELYTVWYPESLRLLRAVEKMEEVPYDVDGANVFRANIEKVSNCRDQLNRILKATDSLQHGRGVSLEDALNVLRGDRCS